MEQYFWATDQRKEKKIWSFQCSRCRHWHCSHWFVAAAVLTRFFARSALNGFRLWNCFLVDYTHTPKKKECMNEMECVSSKFGIYSIFGILSGYQWISTSASYFIEHFSVIFQNEWNSECVSLSYIGMRVCVCVCKKSTLSLKLIIRHEMKTRSRC